MSFIISILSKDILIGNINLLIMVINLIPIYPLDGYNVLETILRLIKVKSIEKIKNIIEVMVIIILANVGIYQVIFLKNPSIILMVFYIFIQRSNPRNNCNSRMYQKYYKNITKF